MKPFADRFPFDSFRTKEEVKWKTLVHRITTARRVKGGLLVSHASRFSIGCRLPAYGKHLTDEPLWRTRAGVRNTSAWDRVVPSLTSRL